MDFILIIMLWEISLAGAFILGGMCKKKKPQANATKMTKEEQKAFNRMQKEQENFMNYDGTPQDAIND